jgi:hypothetical protein
LGKGGPQQDINGAMPGYAPDVLTFDVVNPLQYIGRDAATKRTEGWFSSGPINCEIRDLHIATEEDVASSPQPQPVQRNKERRWMVTHQHLSVPFDPESGQASLDLQP